jgi:selenocysteine lyase/cysteine desulfurase
MEKNHRQLFDIPENIAYLNCAGNSPQLKKTTEALIKGAIEKSHPWERKPGDFFNEAEKIRILASEIFGSDADGYCVIPSASYGISAAARIMEPRLGVDDKILLMEEEFPSNVLPWRRVAKETGAEIITVKIPEDNDWTKAVIEKINKSTRVVAISSCHWTNGLIVNLDLVKEKCAEVDALLVVDATQSLGANPVEIDKLQPDFLVASGYKWLLSPYGFSLMYVSARMRNSRPLEESWLARQNASNFAGLVNYNHEYMPGARRFDVGEKNTATILPGVISAFEQIKLWGTDYIAGELKSINKIISDFLRNSGFNIPDEKFRSPHMFGATQPHWYKGNLLQQLADENIFISKRGNSLRFAPHLNIDQNDLDRIINVLEKLLKK